MRGVIIISGVRSRYVTACSGVILIILSIIPKFSAIATMIPASVFGGATLVIFAFITVAGIDTLTKSVDMTKMGNMMVVGISVSVGLMFNGQGGSPFSAAGNAADYSFPGRDSDLCSGYRAESFIQF
ncbi:solute carrier family 23 protein [Morganella morganii]|nr:solute carrier family 23 protein [Morganella morganii]